MALANKSACALPAFGPAASRKQPNWLFPHRKIALAGSIRSLHSVLIGTRRRREEPCAGMVCIGRGFGGSVWMPESVATYGRRVGHGGRRTDHARGSGQILPVSIESRSAPAFAG